MKITILNTITLKNTIAFLCLLFSIHTLAQESTFLNQDIYRITSNNDDVEESEYGVLEFGSSDLELVDEYSKQAVGLRFSSVSLPRNTEIVSAYLQFTTDEITEQACHLTISGELTGDANIFENLDKNVRSRKRTNNTIQWTPQAWSIVNESSSAQKSTDISSIIQEIVNQNNWNTGNAIVVIIEGEGTRNAVSYDNNPDLAPKLIIETKSPSVNVALDHVFINEIMAKNNVFVDEYGESNDWIELYNSNTEPAYIGGIFLSDDVNELTKWQLSRALTIEANGFALIWADNDTIQGSLHSSFKISSAGETIILSQILNNKIEIIDMVTIPALLDDVSYGRKDDGTENWIILGQSSPNNTNNLSKPIFFPPTVTLESGIYDSEQLVNIFSEIPDVDIYYTIDGTIPDSTSFSFSSPIAIDSTTLLKVIAYKKGYTNSNLIERFYMFHHDSDLPIINISTDPKNLWDDYTGIYVEGKNGTTHPNYNIPSNFFQPWERPALITMIEPDGKIAFRENAGIAISGNDSKKLIKKSFNLHFRTEYGTDGVNYQVFKDLDITEFKHLKLRNSGQDFESMMIRDGLNSTIIHSIIDLDHMAYRPVIVYLNNEYWGLYGLRESLTDDYINTHYDVKKSEINLLTREGDLIIDKGSDTDYLKLYEYLKNQDMAMQANYDVVDKLMDINEFINYQIAEIFYANYDWPANNQKMWNTQSGDKWRWMLYDTDASTNYKVWGLGKSFYNSIEHATDEYSNSWPNNAKSTVIFRGLLQNESFKHEFTQRMCTYMALVFNPERVFPITDSLVSLVYNEMDRDIAKWTKAYRNFGIGEACGGTKENWESYIVDYKNFFIERPNYMFQHIKDKFNIENTYSLRFNYNENTGGTIYVNSNDFEVPYNYTAEYFSSYPLKIKAVANEGYKFIKWLETGDTKPETSYIGTESSVLTPIFDIANAVDQYSSNTKVIVYPNPINEDIAHISLTGFLAKENLELSIHNITGQIIKNITLNELGNNTTLSISTANWKRGIYFLKVRSEYSQKTTKFIIE